MNIGHLKNESFVNDYKKLGFNTRNQLIDAALELFKKAKAREQREAWRKAAHKEYFLMNEENAWKDLEGEDFED